jgi:hypothetical protein
VLVGAAGVLGSAAWSRHDESRLMARVAPRCRTARFPSRR